MSPPKKAVTTVSTKGHVIFPKTTSDQVFGMLCYKGQPKSLEEMDQAILDEAKPSELLPVFRRQP